MEDAIEESAGSGVSAGVGRGGGGWERNDIHSVLFLFLRLGGGGGGLFLVLSPRERWMVWVPHCETLFVQDLDPDSKVLGEPETPQRLNSVVLDAHSPPSSLTAGGSHGA